MVILYIRGLGRGVGERERDGYTVESGSLNKDEKK
jgi:hypothetical protein